MVVLTEEFHGLTLKRKGAEEPELFDAGGDDRSGFLPSIRATKMRRLVCPDGRAHQDAAAAGSGVTTTAAAGLHDVPMGDARVPAPTPRADGEEDKAMMLYEVAANLPRLRPCAALRAGADDWVVRAMLREADSRTVRELLSGGQEQGGDLALAVVPWVAPAPAETEPSTPPDSEDGGGDSEGGAAAMDVEEGEEHDNHWSGYGSGAVGGCSEAYAFRWPQHCMAPPQLPTVAQATPVTWSW